MGLGLGTIWMPAVVLGSTRVRVRVRVRVRDELDAGCGARID